MGTVADAGNGNGRGVNIGSERLSRVPSILEAFVAAHETASADFRDLAYVREELLSELTQKRKIRMCSDDKLDPYEIVGYAPGLYDIVRTAGYMEFAAFTAEFDSEYHRAAAAGKSLLWLDLIHPDECVALNGDRAFGEANQDREWEYVSENYPGAVYVAGEIITSTRDLKVRAKTPDGQNVFFDPEMAQAAIPEKYRFSDRHEEHYVCDALLAANFPKAAVYPLCQILLANLNHPGREPKTHMAKYGVTGLGLSWMSGSVFPVTANVENEPLMASAERSMGIGINLIDQNTDPEDPILWLCCQTFTGTPKKWELKDEAMARARKMVEQASGFQSLHKWYEDGKVVLVPAILDRVTSRLTPLEYHSN